jgi:Zn-dependent protease with chaperone function
MLAKPIIFFLTFLLAMANFLFLLIPIAIVLSPILIIFKEFFIHSALEIMYLMMGLVSFLTMLYMFIDMLFGYTAGKLNKHAEKLKKMSAVPRCEDILRNFEFLKNKFNVKNVDLYLLLGDKSVNAYAIGGARRQSVTLTIGLVFEVYEKCNNEDDYIKAITAIIGHELSHLINRDFLPGLLAGSSQMAIEHIAKIMRYMLMMFADIFRFIPIFGRSIRTLIYWIFNLITKFISLFYKWMFMPLYNFVKKWFGRSVEYRCDKQAAYAVGGRAMVLGLQALGTGSYFSIFSTHPKTKDRINYVKKITPVSGKIRSSVINNLADFISMTLVVLVMYISFLNADIALINQNYNRDIKEPIMQKYSYIRYEVTMFYYEIIKSR